MRELKNIQGGRSQKTLDRYFCAVKSKDNSRLEDLIINHNIDVNVTDYSGKTALFHAINTHNVSAVMLLIKQSCDVNQSSYVAYHRDNQLLSCVEPPLITAVRVGCHEVLQLLLTFGAKIDRETEIRKRDDLLFKDKTALSFAVEDNKVEDVVSLLQHHAEVNREDSTGELPIHKAVRCRDCEKQSDILRHLCEHGSDINHVNKIDCSPLYLATFYGCFNKVHTLLLYGADINRTCKRENSYGSALHVAASKDKEDIAKILLRFGANMNISNALGYTPLKLNIKSHGQSLVAKLLIQHGTAVDGVDQRGYTLMATIIKNMRLDCESLARLLVYSGYDLSRDHWLKPKEENAHGDDTPTPVIPIPHGRVETLCNWLRERQCNADRLANLCRISVRSSLKTKSNGCSILESISVLPIPTSLKSFVLLNDGMY